MATAPATPAATFSRRFRDSPQVFQWFAGAVLTAAAAGFLAVLLLVGWDRISRLLDHPAVWILWALTLAADLYPWVPWLRDIRGRVLINWSAVLLLAMMIGFGPAALVFYPFVGMVAVNALEGAWWRKAFNIGVMIIEGLVGALVIHLFWTMSGWDRFSSAGRLLISGVVVAVLWDMVNVLLIAAAQTLSGLTGWWQAIRANVRKTVMWLAALVTAPMIAELARVAPIMLPTLIVVILMAHHNVATVTRRRDEARTDALTGLPNRTAAMERLTRRLDHRERRGSEVTMMLIDLDGFKAVNDTHGHHAGDEVLVQVGARIAAVVAPDSLVARLGGDEFVVVCGPLPDAAAIAARIDAAVQRPMQLDELVVTVECTIGWATARPGTEPMDLFRLVDRNLYRFKQAGDGRDSGQDPGIDRRQNRRQHVNEDLSR
ncbi:MAG: diguanylate cyclase [Actinomycetota bacterium]|nr:diguanylate cyclase [Actinomycetota bacterium]